MSEYFSVGPHPANCPGGSRDCWCGGLPNVHHDRQDTERLIQAITPGMVEVQRHVNQQLSMQAEAIMLRPVKRMSLWDRLRARVWRWFR